MDPKRSKSSFIWNFYKEKQNSDSIATCTICKQNLSYKSTSNNLRKHLQRKHPCVNLGDCAKRKDLSNNAQTVPQVQNPDISNLASTSSSGQENPIQNSTPKPAALVQTTVDIFATRKIKTGNKKVIDDALMLLFTKDFQPFSVVEDTGFKTFVNALNPSYEIPSRKTLTNSFLPAIYESVLNDTKQIMNEVKAVTLTTDSWTSRNCESFLAVTAHFVSKDLELKSVLLECSSFGESHTSYNISKEIKKVLAEWNLEGKVLLVVSDNAANIKKAIKEELKLVHFGCYAHTVNLIAQDNLKLYDTILLKLRTIINHFKRSSTATAKFQQQQKNANKEPKKLIADVPTRWNSVFYMVDRFVELEEFIKTTTALLDKNFPIIRQEEWEVLREFLQIFKPLENLTNIISGQNYVTASSVIVLTDGLLNIYSTLKPASLFSKNRIKSIVNSIQTRLGDLESNQTLIIATFLDPRFKNFGFSNELIAEKAKDLVISLLTNKNKNVSLQCETDSSETPCQTEENSMWGKFDKKIAGFQPIGTPHSKAIIEVQRYMEELPINRHEDPIKWWKANAYHFPQLSELVKENFITVATSVPCERIFSKSGQLISERRNRLSPSKVKKILFLNCNQR